ncbi:unnamed protein product [Paramecium sonneborni]|uniref:Uncharacterized protein n=1 Tax=Paramecium sonneborni TaxID=65129 RepID=A0A8S1NMU5_9CILI|nr:unnamed protein product [Paramecium sonneborni]
MQKEKTNVEIVIVLQCCQQQMLKNQVLFINYFNYLSLIIYMRKSFHVMIVKLYMEIHIVSKLILRHEYSKLGTMGYVILDKVDSMFIDGNNNKTILITPIPGMLDLNIILGLIWDQICKVEPNLLTNKKVWIRSRWYDEKKLNNQLRCFNKFYPLVSFKLYQQGVNYKIDNDNIRIGDYQNTGVVHKENKQLEKGFHQFLQIKHKVPVTPLRISTNYLSKISYFKRYRSQHLGLTDTLGSKITLQLLDKQYNIIKNCMKQKAKLSRRIKFLDQRVIVIVKQIER